MLSGFSGQKKPFQPNLIWWLVAVVLGSSSIASLVSIGWQEIQEYRMLPAQYEIIDYGFNEKRQTLGIIIQNTGGKRGVITEIKVNGIPYDEFITDFPVGGRELQKYQFQKAFVAFAPPGELFTICVPIEQHRSLPMTDMEICIEQQIGAEQSEQCRTFHK